MTGAVLTPTSKVLFQQGHATVPIESIASGIGPGEQPGLNMALFSHTGVAYPLQALSYDPSGEMGITDGAGATALGLDADDPGGTVVETSADGSQVGAVINTQDLTQGGTVPFGPMALLTQWQAPETVAPFADPANGALVAQLDLSVPYSEFPGGPGAQTSSNQVVLYLGLTDTVSGRQIAYGSILFDSRGKASPFFGADNGVGGTGAAIVAQAAGAASRYDVSVPGAASFQGAAWIGSEHFALEITPATLEAAITAFNNNVGPATPFSTDLSRYILTNVSVDAEVEYFGQANSFSYSVSNLAVSEEAAPLSAAQVAASSVGEAVAASSGAAATTDVAATAVTTTGVTTTGVTTTGAAASLASASGDGTGGAAAGPVTSVTGGAGAETIVASAGTSYAVQGGAGALTFLGSDAGSTVVGGAGDLDASGGAGRLTAFAGSGSATLVGGAAGGNILAGGSGNATLVGASGGPGDLLLAGSGSAAVFAGGGHSTVFGGTGASMLVSSVGDDLLVAGHGSTVVYTGAGSDTVWGSPSADASTVVVAGSGLALVAGGAGADTLYGGAGAATLAGGSGAQLMVAGSGGTLVFAGSGADTVFGGPAGGAATVVGGATAALVVLEAGAATVQAGSGGDTVFGGTGGDAIDTGAGATTVVLSAASARADTVTFGSGSATVGGGGAAHSFLFGEAVGGLDVISGFRAGVDRLVMAAPQQAAALAGAHDGAAGLVLPLAGGGSVLLQGVHAAASVFG